MKRCREYRPRGGLLLVASLVAALPIAGCGGSAGAKADRQKAEAYVQRGEDYLMDGNTDKALAAYNKAIEVDPNCQKAFVRRGLLHDEAGRTEEALADYAKAIEIDPSDSYPYEQRARIYRDVYHDPAKAEAESDRAFEVRQQRRDEMQNMNRER